MYSPPLCVRCAVTTLGVVRMDTCIEVPKGTPVGDVVSRLGAEDTAAATSLFIQWLQDLDVDTRRVGVRYESAVASPTCTHTRAESNSESELGKLRRRVLIKRESKVDGDQADTIGLSFKFAVIGNALDVAAAVGAANHLPYKQAGSDVAIFRSRVLLNYGSGSSLLSPCACCQAIVFVYGCIVGDASGGVTGCCCCCCCCCVVQCAT